MFNQKTTISKAQFDIDLKGNQNHKCTPIKKHGQNKGSPRAFNRVVDLSMKKRVEIEAPLIKFDHSYNLVTNVGTCW